MAGNQDGRSGRLTGLSGEGVKYGGDCGVGGDNAESNAQHDGGTKNERDP
jgi:hypothetical protein